MKEQIVKLENSYYRNVLNVMEDLLKKLPDPACEQKSSRSITRYCLCALARKDDIDKQVGGISINYSKSIMTGYGMMVGRKPENDPLVFECCQR